ncbi:hypothetical protein BK126_26195 [Paenibacillus sp. FSL H7-0326]|uniref:hypothetical protein n=1 Tax=Paenibacillus sp. FSL H7-0326 TaxID=1921144 RepID=UPI00096C413B|nr:hypothetical protein [Paenibacillus sp. FSL H7-0326]OMC63687.1 hypothetical protein BK126_26195 [Paenibacillus sp. FSL H7-0326]
MHTVMKWGAMYGQLEDGDEISPAAIQLGNQLILPGDRITRIGKKKRSMFSMQDGFYLVYQGICDHHLMFTSEPTGCSGDPWYYSFAYVDSTTLLIGGKGCMDIRVDDLQLA